MSRPRLLDLFSGAGGAAAGYIRAGFDVTGVDIRAQPRYPGAFVQADALEYLAEHGRDFDAIHASPPCQSYSTHVTSTASRWAGTLGQDEPRLIAETRALLEATGRPWIIENRQGTTRRNSGPLARGDGDRAPDDAARDARGDPARLRGVPRPRARESS